MPSPIPREDRAYDRNAQGGQPLEPLIRRSCCYRFHWSLRNISSASSGSTGCRNLSAIEPPPAQSLGASRSNIRSLLSSSMRAVLRGSSLCSSKESFPKQTKRSKRDVSWRPFFATHGRSSFLQNRSRLRTSIDPIVATLYCLRSALFDTWVTCAGTLAICRRHLVAHLSSFVTTPSP